MLTSQPPRKEITPVMHVYRVTVVIIVMILFLIFIVPLFIATEIWMMYADRLRTKLTERKLRKKERQ